jgi:GMP synthase-like glutamine amidotransferase
MTRLLAGYAIRMDIRSLQNNPTLPPDLDNIEAIIALDTTASLPQATTSPWFQPEKDLIVAAHNANLPVIGIGFGAHLIALALGGQVKSADPPHTLGWCDARLTFPGTIETLLAGQPWRSHQFLTKTDYIEKLPPAATPLMTGPDRRIRAFKSGVRTFAIDFNIELENDQLRNPDTLVPGTSRTSADRTTLADFDRLNTRLIRSLADYLLPITRPQRP